MSQSILKFKLYRSNRRNDISKVSMMMSPMPTGERDHEMPDNDQQKLKLTKIMNNYKKDLEQKYNTILSQYDRMYFASKKNVSDINNLVDCMNTFKKLMHKWNKLGGKESNDFGYTKLDYQICELISQLDQMDLVQSSLLSIRNCMLEKIMLTRELKSREFHEMLKKLVKCLQIDVLQFDLAEYLENTKPMVNSTRIYLQKLYDATSENVCWDLPNIRLLKKELSYYNHLSDF